jgi:hypothetical protein
VAAFLSITMRGWWFPGRMLVPVLPLLAIPLAETLAYTARRPVMAALASLLGAYTVAVTAALVMAGRAGQIAIVVDPFALPWPPFQRLAGLFPLYSEYTPETWLLTAAWLVVGTALAGASSLSAAGWACHRPGAAGAPGDVPAT